MNLLQSIKKLLLIIAGTSLIAVIALAIWFRFGTCLTPPTVEDPAICYMRAEVSPDYFVVGSNWLRRNQYGIWEMYLEGTPYERGLIYGVLAEELINQQEQVFVDQIRNMIPSESILKWLRYFIGWFNRDIDQYVPEENLKEIYGISRAFSTEFNYIGEPYYRVLNYHAAHDIGHALTDLNMVGCTSFAVNGSLSADSTLIIGRNFDFNMGDRFAENKLILFMKPDKGYAFASVTWAGFTGVVSGMNEKGLTVTLNAAKSDIPYKAKTPISLLAREILQYAQNIEEAVTIAQKRETFVSESLLIGSAQDNKAVIIEKTPSKMDVFDSGEPLTVCSNHYQSAELSGDPANVENIRLSDSHYRFERMNQLLESRFPIDLADGVAVLRDKSGMDDRFIGYGNPKSINQLLAHHGIVFKPEQRKFWVSSNPYSSGTFVGYDLTAAFSGGSPVDTASIIAPDPFLASKDYHNFESFKYTRNRIVSHLMTGNPLEISEKDAEEFISNNPESYLPYMLLGDYHYRREDYEQAKNYFELCLSRELPSENERKSVLEKLEKCTRKIK